MINSIDALIGCQMMYQNLILSVVQHLEEMRYQRSHCLNI